MTYKLYCTWSGNDKWHLLQYYCHLFFLPLYILNTMILFTMAMLKTIARIFKPEFHAMIIEFSPNAILFHANCEERVIYNTLARVLHET